MADTHEGGCLCGAVRYRVEGDPVRSSVCHCTFCQRRTGSAFATAAFFPEERVTLTGDTLSEYEHVSDESQTWLRLGFCHQCGTTVGVTIERLPGARGVFVGTFDDPNWVKIDKHIWTRSAVKWMVFPPGVECHEKSPLS